MPPPGQRDDIAVGDVLFLVAEAFELFKQFINTFGRQRRIPQRNETLFKGVTSGMLAQNDLVLRNPNALRRKDFIRLPRGHDAVLMDAGFMSEDVFADDRFVR